MHQNFYEIFHGESKLKSKFGTGAALRKLKRSERMQINLTDSEGNLRNIGFFPESDEEDDHSMASHRVSSTASKRMPSMKRRKETTGRSSFATPEPKAKQDNILEKLKGITPKDKALFMQLLKYSKKPSGFRNHRKSVLPALKVKKKQLKKPGKVRPSTVRYSFNSSEDVSKADSKGVEKKTSRNTIISKKFEINDSKGMEIPKPVKPFSHRIETKLKCKPENSSQHFDVSDIVKNSTKKATKENSFRASSLPAICNVNVKEKLLAKLIKRHSKVKKDNRMAKSGKKTKKVKSGVDSLKEFEVRHLPALPVKCVRGRSRPNIADGPKCNLEKKARVLAEKFEAERRKNSREDERIRLENKRIEDTIRKERVKMKFEEVNEDTSLKERQKRKIPNKIKKEDELASYSSYEMEDDKELKKHQMAMEKTYERLRRANGAENDADSKDSRETVGFRRTSITRDDHKPHGPPLPLVEVVVPASKPEVSDSHNMMITLNKENVKTYIENDINRVSELSGVRVDSTITFLKVGQKIAIASRCKPKVKRVKGQSLKRQKSSDSHEAEFEQDNVFKVKPPELSSVSRKKQELRVRDEVKSSKKKYDFSHLRASVFTRKKRSIKSYPSSKNTITLRNYQLNQYNFKHDKQSKGSKSVKIVKSKASPLNSSHKFTRPKNLPGVFNLNITNQLEPGSEHFRRKSSTENEEDFSSKFEPEELAQIKKLIPQEFLKLPKFSPEALRKIASPQPKELNADEKNIISTMKRAHDLTMESFFASWFF